MKTLILYATTEGQTRKIAEFIADKLKAAGDDVTLLDAADTKRTPDPAGYDIAILAASIHIGRYQSSIVHAARDHHERLNRMSSLFVSVSLAAAGTDPDDLAGIAECAAKFQAETGWREAQVLHVAGAFRFTEYDFFKSWAMRSIARSKHVSVKAGEDLELTNWDKLAREVHDFRAAIAG